ncbi:MAG TPA: CoA pyrophosphatase [Chromatiales bacterium]|nr:CoA pyrophosphatase [Chromatiales bacterium]
MLQRLAGVPVPADPVREALDRLGPDIAEKLFDAPLIPAAVLVPLIDRAGGLQVLLTRRTDHLHDHPGQISFPGGRVEAGDTNAVATALREAEEEVGLRPERIELAGYLPPHAVVTGFAITPVVGIVPADIELELDRFEVAEAFEVPLAFFLEPANWQRSERVVRGQRLPVAEFQFERHRIWGATAQILDSLIKIINT